MGRSVDLNRRTFDMNKLITIVAAAVLALPVAMNAAAQPTQASHTKRKCHPSYKLKCLKPNAYDYDCIGGSGNGPLCTGLVKVVGRDVFRLDADHDGGLRTRLTRAAGGTANGTRRGHLVKAERVLGRHHSPGHGALLLVSRRRGSNARPLRYG